MIKRSSFSNILSFKKVNNISKLIKNHLNIKNKLVEFDTSYRSLLLLEDNNFDVYGYTADSVVLKIYESN